MFVARNPGILSLFSLCLAPPLAADPAGYTAVTYYGGACDGSAGVQIDADTLLIANDETNDLRSYDVLGGAAVAKTDLTTLPGMPDLPDDDDEIDIEAVARQGDRLWWIGSHSRNRTGKKRDNRRLLFSTSIPGRDLSGLHVMSHNDDLYKQIRDQVLDQTDLSKDDLKRAPKQGGLNIEGMTFADDGTLLIGLRAPLDGKSGTEGKALLLRMTMQGAAWRVDGIDTLDLQDRGIRAIETVADGYVLIAGAVESGGASAIYHWDGTDAPTHIASRALEGLNPEAILEVNGRLLVISDDGTGHRVDEQTGKLSDCKALAKKNDAAEAVFFRAVVLPR